MAILLKINCENGIKYIDYIKLILVEKHILSQRHDFT